MSREPSPLVDPIRAAYREAAQLLADAHRGLDHPEPDPACNTCRILTKETADAR
jgi:hypothetical protein